MRQIINNHNIFAEVVSDQQSQTYLLALTFMKLAVQGGGADIHTPLLLLLECKIRNWHERSSFAVQSDYKQAFISDFTLIFKNKIKLKRSGAELCQAQQSFSSLTIS